MILFVLLSSRIYAFTQSGGGIDFIGNSVPMGHEWITRLSAFELFGDDDLSIKTNKDPRKFWLKGKAKNLYLGQAENKLLARLKQDRVKDERAYESKYLFIYSAIIGQRWVDIGGFSVPKASLYKINCFNAVTQNPAVLQQDHFLRQPNDIGGQGGVNAIKRSQARFIKHFVTAALAPQQNIRVADGGGDSTSKYVDYNFFLFGRAAHLFQDAFSSEHVVRLAVDQYETIRQIKGYLCTKGSEQHSHSKQAVASYRSGDVIWKAGTRFKAGWKNYRPSYLKNIALIATEANKDLWAAFIRTLATPIFEREAKAKMEAQALVNNWLAFEEKEVLNWYANIQHRHKLSYVRMDADNGSGISQKKCLIESNISSASQVVALKKINADRRICLYNLVAKTGYGDLYDPYLKIPLYWKWKKFAKWTMPPKAWKVPEVIANSGKQIMIRSKLSQQSMTAPAGIALDSNLLAQEGAPLKFIIVGDPQKGAYLRVSSNAKYFLSFTKITGAIKLYFLPYDAKYQIRKSNNRGLFFIKDEINTCGYSVSQKKPI